MYMCILLRSLVSDVGNEWCVLMKIADSLPLHVVLQFWPWDVPKVQPPAECSVAQVCHHPPSPSACYPPISLFYRESYEIGRGCANVGAIKQGRTLRLLANAFLEWDKDAYWQKALNAIGQYVKTVNNIRKINSIDFVQMYVQVWLIQSTLIQLVCC